MSMEDELVRELKKLKNSKLSETVDARVREFEDLGRKGNKDWFSEMCFCVLTANCSAQSGIKAQKYIGDGFMEDSEKILAARLKETGYRFPNTRAKFITGARRFWDIKDKLKGRKSRNARRWLIEHVKGLGKKESSHFLRNVGYKDVAIIDRHILRVMQEYGMISKIPNSINRRFYDECEDKLELLAERVGMSLAELDLYLWYMKTGKVLK